LVPQQGVPPTPRQHIIDHGRISLRHHSIDNFYLTGVHPYPLIKVVGIRTPCRRGVQHPHSIITDALQVVVLHICGGSPVHIFHWGAGCGGGVQQSFIWHYFCSLPNQQASSHADMAIPSSWTNTHISCCGRIGKGNYNLSVPVSITIEPIHSGCGGGGGARSGSRGRNSLGHIKVIDTTSSGEVAGCKCIRSIYVCVCVCIHTHTHTHLHTHTHT
jgi:hypothetical protein